MALALKVLYLGFKFVCGILAVLLIADFFYKYLKNEDISLLKYTRYLKGENDDYPVISFCFKDPFLKQRLAEYGITDAIYRDYLEGKIISNELLEIDYDKVTLDVNDYLVEHYILWVNGTVKQAPVDSKNGRKQFETSVSFSGFINQRFFKCFSLHHDAKQMMRLESFKLQQEIFQNRSRASYYSFITLLHYPSQALRSLGTLRRVWKNRKDTSDYSMHFQLTGMDVMNRRQKKNDHCNPNWRNYDISVIEEKIRKSGCRMTYETANMSAPKCNTKAAIIENKKGPDHYEESGLQPPCRSVEKIGYAYDEYDLDATEWAGKGYFWVTLEIMDQKHKEIDQHR